MEKRIVYHQRGKDPLYKTWHASKEHLFIFFYSDGGSIVSNEQVFPIKKGTLVLIAANTYHYTMPDEPAIYDRSKLAVLPYELDKISDLLSKSNIFKSFFDKAIVYAEIDENDRDEVDGIFKEMNGCKSFNEELTLFSCLLRLLCFFDKYTIESTPATIGFMSKAIKYINENISLDINIDKICSAINISKYYFCRQFKKHTGMTVMNYILKTRIVLAKNELKKTNLSITEISGKYGFSSTSYFCRVFKEEENCSPLQYRKRGQI
ncbi:MAG: helix-turn-helix transcriptional regulator [Clostridia bacterium]|nr:helix-turn-helix transcriptional regulator [Clostridia bacterium]